MVRSPVEPSASRILSDWLADTPAALPAGAEGVAIHEITDDSRSCGPGVAFIARQGATTDGREYIPDALGRGAAAILADAAPPTDRPEGVAWVRYPDLDQAEASKLAERFFDFPARKLRLIGITGTNGKTTIATLAHRLLAGLGTKTGLIGTIEIDDGQSVTPATLTTPGAVEMSRLLGRMVAWHCEAAVMEVSSHALDQGRVAGLDFDLAVFTNLTGDHLDYHLTMEAYADAKAMLFESLTEDALAVVNLDDRYAERMLRDCRARVWGCRVTDGPTQAAADGGCVAEIESMTVRGAATRMRGPWGEMALTLPLIGRHNLANALQAAAVVHAVSGCSADDLSAQLAATVTVPGRLERVTAADAAKPAPTVLVDYAHTHDALANVLAAVRPLVEGRLHVVFGCGGDRDTTKRPKMAQEACRFADRVIITSDNPRTEDAQRIIDAIVAGVPRDATAAVTLEPDRAAAIAAAIAEADPRDTIVIAGKGHEDYQIIGKKKRPFDDRIEARRALNQYEPKPKPKPV